ncbi:MAG: PQQ-binding-like beta-propeller repeat protein [Opitutae bacterium]|nr:PQQ-binding-like beta-propeller repeat protein [Opitutae bacterium]
MLPARRFRHALLTLLCLFGLRAMGSTVPTDESPRLTAKELAQGHRDGVVLAMPRAAESDDALDDAEARDGLKLRRRFPRVRGLRVLEFDPGESTAAAIKRLRASGRYEFVEPDRILYARALPNDTRFSEQWALNNTGQSSGTIGADIGAAAAWDQLSSASGVIVGIIDTGIRQTHADLAANLWTNPSPSSGSYVNDLHGINATVAQGSTNSGNPNDNSSSGHGTHVAGTIGAVGNNGLGVSGVAWQTQLMALKFLAADGTGTTSAEVACIDYAIAHNVAIINGSYGSSSYSNSEFDALKRARDAGIIFVAAAGNDGANSDITNDYPAGYALDNIVAVAATTRTDALASYSNYGAGLVDLAAPGSAILSTINSSDTAYGSLDGTSMAAPHVTGALALLKARFPSDSYRQLINRLLRSTTKLPGLTGKVQTGGRLNLAAALASTDSRPINDHFSERNIISGEKSRVRTSNVGATRESGEPTITSNDGGASLWWSWTAPTTSTVMMDTAGSGCDTLLAVYTGSALGNLQLVSANDDSSASLTTSRVVFSSVAGTTYQIAVEGKSGATGLISLQLGSVPANDLFTTATLLTGSTLSVAGSNRNATADTGEPKHTSAGKGHSVWYRWVAPGTGRYHLAVFATEIDAVASVYTGSAVSSLTLVASNNDSIPYTSFNAPYNSDSIVPIDATAGQTYYFAVDDTGATGGNFKLTLNDSVWQYPTGDEVTSSPAVGSDGSICFGSVDRYVYQLKRDGTLKWKYAAGAGVYLATPAIGSDGTVYIGADDGYLHAINGNTGVRKWRFPTTSTLAAAPAIATDGTIYVRDDTNLYALTDGATAATRKWTFALGGATYGSPVVASDGTIYIGSTSGNFHALKPDGTKKWTFTANGDVYTSPALAADGTIYFGTLNGYVYAVRADGTQLWSWNTADGSKLTSSPVLGVDGTLYFGGYDHKLHALNSANGQERWSFPTDDEIRACTPAVAADGTIYVGDLGGKMYAITASGTARRTYATAMAIRSSPIIADGRLYFGSSDAKLYAFALDGSAAASVWPMGRQNAARTAQASSGTPVITAQPQSQTALLGGTLTLQVTASGTVTGYQWYKDGAAIAGATGATLTINPVTASTAGVYTVALTGPLGTTTSSAATVTVQAGQAGRLTNLSVRAAAGTSSQTLIAGFVIGGTGADRSILLRGVGPGLAPYGVTDAITNPRLALLNSAQQIVATNDDWGGAASLQDTFTRLGAFPLSSSSKDAALVQSLSAQSYTMQITDGANGAGVALAEVYDADTSTALPALRLINVSARASVGVGGQILIAGFVISGDTKLNVLIRGVGPTLTGIGVPGALANPKLELYRDNTLVQSNDDWGGTTALINAATEVGAFALPSATSKDAALLVQLDPGTYTAQVSGVGGTTGVALVEVYAVP